MVGGAVIADDTDMGAAATTLPTGSSDTDDDITGSSFRNGQLLPTILQKLIVQSINQGAVRVFISGLLQHP